MGNCIQFKNNNSDPPPYHDKIELVSNNDLNDKITLLEDKMLKEDNIVKNNITTLSSQYQKLYNELTTLKENNITTLSSQYQKLYNELTTLKEEEINKNGIFIITSDEITNVSILPSPPGQFMIGGDGYYDIRIGIKLGFNIKIDYNIQNISKKILVMKTSYNLYCILTGPQLKPPTNDARIVVLYIDKSDALNGINSNPEVSPQFAQYQVLPVVYNNVFIFTTDYQIINITRNFTFDINGVYSHTNIHSHLYKTTNAENQIKVQLYKTLTCKHFELFDHAMFDVIKDKIKTI